MVQEDADDLRRQLLDNEWRLLRAEVRNRALVRITVTLIDLLRDHGITHHKRVLLDELQDKLIVTGNR